MRFNVCWMLIVGWLAVASQCGAHSSLPPRWNDLPRQAASWPSAWATLVSEVAPPRDDFEKKVMQRVGALLTAAPPSKEDFRFAEIVVAATLRRHESMRESAPLADNPQQALHAELAGMLANIRKDWLLHLEKAGATAEALRLAEQWLPTAARNGPVRSAILHLWIHQAKSALEKPDYPAARRWLNRIETAFIRAADADEIRKPLRERAANLLKEAKEQPDGPARRMLEEALALWPRLPGARDALEQRQGTYKTLVVAVRSLPEQMSPATACTEIERQTLELLFDRLYRLEQSPSEGKHYRPQLATALATPIPLHRDVYWSSGERLTAADLRHTALLMNQTDAVGRSALWRDFLEIPQLERAPFQLNVRYRQGLFDPLAPLTFMILPRSYQGKELQRADDPEFAKKPVGSGLFQYVGRKPEGSKTVAVFQANPCDLRQAPSSLREIRMTTWTDAGKDLPKPLPHLIVDAPTNQLPALKQLGYIENELKQTTCVHFLAVNHRKPTLASVPVRRAIAHAIDRQALLNRHFRSEALEGKYHTAANSLFPHGSWANAPSPRVPADLFDAEQARSSARKVKKQSAPLEWTLKYPAGDAHVKSACEAMARSIVAIFQEAGVKADVQPLGLPPRALQKALNERDYDLLYTSADALDDPVRLALLFDPQEDAIRAGGSNYLGYDNDFKLQELLRAALQRRQFSAVRENMQAVHVHLYEKMPAIPLWRLDVHVLTHPSLRAGMLDPRAVFAGVRDWKIVP